MSTSATAQLPMSVLDDDAWDDLLSFIEERRVIPIIGPELLQVATERGPRLLYDWLAEKLAGRLSVDVSQLPQPYTLNDVVCWFLGTRGRREEAYVRLRSILKDAAFEPPQGRSQAPGNPQTRRPVAYSRPTRNCPSTRPRATSRSDNQPALSAPSTPKLSADAPSIRPASATLKPHTRCRKAGYQTLAP
jgi:hypothetical protein